MEVVLEQVEYINSRKKILENINLNIKKGNITTIIGKSGSGKTSLAEIINLLTSPTTGIVKYATDYKVGMVFQNPEEQFFSSTVEKEITFGLNFNNKDINEIKKKVQDALTMVGLDDSYLNRNPFSLSCGEKRKVAIASILAMNPKTLILDEPTLGLDNKSKKSLIKIIKLLKQRYNKTIVVITKDSEFAHLISDEVVILYEGKIVLQGNKFDVFTSDIEKYGVKKPQIIEFEQLARKEKNIRLLYRDDINDLMKDVYRYVK